jgi:hypothetical protein
MIGKAFVYMFIFVSPFLLMILVNEINRPTERFRIKVFNKEVLAYNPGYKLKKSCSWYCHTSGCPHQKFVNKGEFIPRVYHGIIAFNNPTNGERYQRMSIIFLVVFWPLFMFALLVLNIELYFKRKSSRNE